MILRTLITLYLLVLSAGLYAADENYTQDRPVVTWASSPVKPGETVLLHGGNFGKDPVVELTWGNKKQTVVPVSVSESSVMFTYPENWGKGVISGMIRSGNMTSKPFQVNAPAVWWIHGDRGRESSVKQGSLRLFGNCLADPEMSSPPRVSLQNIEGGEKGKIITLQINKYNRFSVQTAEWNEIPEGTYAVLLSQAGENQPVNAGNIRISEKKDEFPGEIYNVVDFGAVPDDGIDDTRAILNATEALKKNGGGVLLFPGGRFQMNETIELPPYSVLKGLGAEYSQVYWPDRYEPLPALSRGTNSFKVIVKGMVQVWDQLPALIRGTHSFKVEDIFLTCGNHRDGIVGTNGNISITNVILRMLYTQYLNDDLDELKRRLPPLHRSRALRLGGENITVTGNNIYCAAGGVFEFRVYWSEISNNNFSRGNIIGWNGFTGQQLIFENNHLGGANCISYYALPEGSENIYWGNNYQENTFDDGNRESITGDLRIIAYQNKVENITPASFTTIKGVNRSGEIPSVFNTDGEISSAVGKLETWKDGAVQIASGKGVGQFRRIKSINGRKVELESAWDIIPDENSVLTITSYRRRFIYTENKTYDSSIALQFYGSMIEAIVANNLTARTGGYNGDTNSDLLGWFNQFFDNTFESGLSYRGPYNQVPAIDAHLSLSGRGSEYPVIRYGIVRNNDLKSNAKLDVIGNIADCLLEGNRVANAKNGAVIDESARNIVLRNNVFKGVFKPYTYDSRSVVIRPFEELWSAMDGVCAQLGWKSEEDMPTAWAEIYKDKSLSAATKDQVSQTWGKAVEAFAKHLAGKPVPGEIAELLLGFDIRPTNWQDLNSILHEGEPGTGYLPVHISGNKIMAHLKLSFRQDKITQDGWKLKVAEANLKPGELTEMKMMITKPAGKVFMFRIPLTGELNGNGWALNFTTELYDPQDRIILDKFRVSRPFENPDDLLTGTNTNNGRSRIKLGYLPYDRIPETVKSDLVEASPESNTLFFDAFYSGRKQDGMIIYGINLLTASSPVNARFEFSSNCLLYVNGKIVGTTLRHGQWGFAQLEKGENKIEMIMMPLEGNNWRIGLPSITWIEDPLAIH